MMRPTPLPSPDVASRTRRPTTVPLDHTPLAPRDAEVSDVSTPPLPLPDERVVCRAMPDGAVLFSLASEVYFGLNTVGAEIWALLPTHRTLAALCGELERRYPDVDPRMIHADVQELLDDLTGLGLLHPAAATSEADALRAAEAGRADAGRVD